MIIKASTKIAVASVLCRYLLSLRWLAGLGPEVDVTRDGIRWHLDLTEGIDLAIYLVGRFEPRTVHVFRCLIREGDVVINIGANISANTMELARCVGPRGRVIAFEPTLFALERLKQNLESNPELSRSVTPEQAALGDDSANSKTSAFYSSWPLLGHTHNGVHERHRGRLKSAVSRLPLDAGPLPERQGHPVRPADQARHRRQRMVRSQWSERHDREDPAIHRHGDHSLRSRRKGRCSRRRREPLAGGALRFDGYQLREKNFPSPPMRSEPPSPTAPASMSWFRSMHHDARVAEDRATRT